MLENNFDTDCPTYESIMEIFPDTTDQSISGEFYHDGKILKRGNEQMTSSIRFYDYSKEKAIIWIDPPNNVIDRVRFISIEPSLPEYKTSGSYKMIHNTIFTAQDRWVEDNCRKAVISAEKWTILLGDTIKLLKNDCDYSKTSFNHVIEKKFEKTIFDISTSYKWQLDQWIKQSKKDCLTLCREY